MPVNIDGSNYVLDADCVIKAVGAEAENRIVAMLGVEVNKWGYINVDNNYMTSITNVFAGGDLIGTEATVACAARDGRNVADCIARLI